MSVTSADFVRQLTWGFPGLVGASLLLFLPPAIATFPQRGSIDPKKLEQRFRDLNYERVEFNKGL